MMVKVNKKAKNAVKQANKIGYGNPPKEHQWQTGQSGNPKGAPVHKVQLWVWISKYMALNEKQIKRLSKKSNLTQVQQTALKIVQSMKDGIKYKPDRMARYIIDRDEGKATEHVVINTENDLTDAECEQLRDMIQSGHDN